MSEKKKRKRIQKTKEVEDYNVDLDVWDILKQNTDKLYYDDMVDLDAPVETEAQRIKRITKETKDLSIADAFKKYYDVEISEEASKLAEFIPKDLRVGDVVDLNIVSISPGEVVFNNTNFKENFTTKTDLWKFKKFHEFLPVNTIKGLIIDKNKQRTVVDIISPMVTDFIKPYCLERWIQNIIDPSKIETIKLKNIRLTKGGYIGNAVIPNVSEWLGEEFTIPAFLPGSQLTLNVTNKFEEYEGCDVDTFITSYDETARGAKLVLSRKSYIRHLGNLKLMELFNMWCDDDDRWKEFSIVPIKGIVTGVINSSKKCGVFVELPEYNITGMVMMPADQLTSYPADAEINIKFSGFDEELEYDEATDQYQHTVPFEIVDGFLKKINIKPVFELVV